MNHPVPTPTPLDPTQTAEVPRESSQLRDGRLLYLAALFG